MDLSRYRIMLLLNGAAVTYAQLARSRAIPSARRTDDVGLKTVVMQGNSQPQQMTLALLRP